MIPARSQNQKMPPPPTRQQSTNAVKLSAVAAPKQRGNRIVLYGTGGVRKTTLACLAPGPVAFIDADESLPILRKQNEKLGVPMPQIVACESWKDVRSALQSSGWGGIKTIALDTATKLEELAVRHVVETVKLAGGKKADGLEDYGYGKGFNYAAEQFSYLLSDLDRHVMAGRNVILIAHDCTCSVPNPEGQDWLRYEPRLQHGSGGKASIRLRVKEWSDSTLWVGYDIAVDKRKAVGGDTRTMWTQERPFCMAKSRTCTEPFLNVTDNIEENAALWPIIFGQ